MLSIIIPTKNEEKLLPLLLQSIKNQDIKYHEIIVADGGSTDRTCDIASNCGCEVVLGESPAKARNNGAKAASGDLLLFLDADVVLDGNKSNQPKANYDKEDAHPNFYQPIIVQVFVNSSYGFINLVTHHSSSLTLLISLCGL